ncbi:hypothetical protein BST95_01730 [Halioglobus japonicus]|uniref:LapA adhesin domain-containing protein n=1 Tax=Halioglobus japonicus TaxID=930805 RepID=A0AAP8SM05_9GAMM|nr:retention module-containing protein [Halioglobus japonicus]AQA17125.1 hypothetical protein BST95_01730 [Halioglobus japonicus]PLW85034.1 hypothetical protein C0029_15995 [Halioglobus japonicus]GHD19131.1 hypothetical protein GCM10007052_27230 [Halioglobus japonicus]
MNQIIGTVAKVEGVVFVRGLDGKIRELNEGDSLIAGEQLLKSPDANVELSAWDLPFSANQDAEVSTAMTEQHVPEGPQSSREDAPDDLEVLLSNYDGDLMDLLEEPAAGAVTGNLGSSFVRVDRIGFELDEIGFGVAANSEAETPLNSVGNAGEAIELTPDDTPEPENSPVLDPPRQSGDEPETPAVSENPPLEVAPEDPGASAPELPSVPGTDPSPESPIQHIPASPETPSQPEASAPSSLLQSGSLSITAVTVVEGSGDATLIATLDVTPAQVFEVSLNNGATFLFDTDYVPGTPVVSSAFPVQDDDAIVDGMTLILEVVAYTSGVFEQLQVPAYVAFNVVDTIDPTQVELSAADIGKGGDITVQATLEYAPETDLNLTLTNAETILIRAGETVGEVTFPGPAALDMGPEGLTLELGIAFAIGGNFERLNLDAVVNVRVLNESPTVIFHPLDDLPDIEGVQSEVYEAGLSPNGSAEGKDSTTTGGTITIADGDGLADITGLLVSDTSVEAGQTHISIEVLASLDVTDSTTWVTFAGQYGAVTLTGYEAGSISYQYDLDGPANHTNQPVTDAFWVAVSDDGSTYSEPASIVINIVDDVVVAADDVNSLVPGAYGPVSGNVIADSDVVSADGAAISYIAGVSVVGYSGDYDFAMLGRYGVLEMNEDGSYQYTRNENTPGGVTDQFTYTLTGDADFDNAELTITIGDRDAVISAPDLGASGTEVYEAGLPSGQGGEPGGSGEIADEDGNNNSDPSETTMGSVVFSGDGGPLIVSIERGGGPVALTGVGQTF